MDRAHSPFRTTDEIKVFPTLVSQESNNLNSLRNIQSYQQDFFFFNERIEDFPGYFDLAKNQNIFSEAKKASESR